LGSRARHCDLFVFTGAVNLNYSNQANFLKTFTGEYSPY
jgi:hypothetical protein